MYLLGNRKPVNKQNVGNVCFFLLLIFLCSIVFLPAGAVDVGATTTGLTYSNQLEDSSILLCDQLLTPTTTSCYSFFEFQYCFGGSGSHTTEYDGDSKDESDHEHDYEDHHDCDKCDHETDDKVYECDYDGCFDWHYCCCFDE